VARHKLQGGDVTEEVELRRSRSTPSAGTRQTATSCWIPPLTFAVDAIKSLTFEKAKAAA
jgi:hypothetical protein